MAVRRAKNQTRPKTAKAKMREDTRAGRRESSDSIPGRGKDATRAAVDKRRTMPRQTRQTLQMEEPAGALRMKAGGKVKKDRRDGIALRGKTRA